jgi:hypothetical protein
MFGARWSAFIPNFLGASDWGIGKFGLAARGVFARRLYGRYGRSLSLTHHTIVPFASNSALKLPLSLFLFNSLHPPQSHSQIYSCHNYLLPLLLPLRIIPHTSYHIKQDQQSSAADIPSGLAA